MDRLLEIVTLLLARHNWTLFLLPAGTIIFSVLAAHAQKRLWQKVRRIPSRQEQQRSITLGRSHLR